jgi:hypothetical protein
MGNKLIIKNLLKDILINIKEIIKSKTLFFNNLQNSKISKSIKTIKSQFSIFGNFYLCYNNHLFSILNLLQNNLQQNQKVSFVFFQQGHQSKCSPLFYYPYRGFYE